MLHQVDAEQELPLVSFETARGVQQTLDAVRLLESRINSANRAIDCERFIDDSGARLDMP